MTENMYRIHQKNLGCIPHQSLAVFTDLIEDLVGCSSSGSVAGLASHREGVDQGLRMVFSKVC
jgi:hypothetical protein